MRNTFLVLVVLGFVLASCHKERTAYPKIVRYEASCDTCQIRYYVDGLDERFVQLNGGWNFSFSADKGEYLFISAYDFDSVGTTSVRILLDDEVFLSASNTGALDTSVLISGYP
ncbi:MAG: hypothetical protein ABI432_00500 [Flavobacteriales bacterium]